MEQDLWWKRILDACNSTSFDLVEDKSKFLDGRKKTKSGVKYSCSGTTGNPTVKMDDPSSAQITIPYEAIYMEKHFYKLKDTYFTIEKKSLRSVQKTCISFPNQSRTFLTVQEIS